MTKMEKTIQVLVMMLSYWNELLKPFLENYLTTSVQDEHVHILWSSNFTKNICTRIFIAPYNSQNCKYSKCSAVQWINSDKIQSIEYHTAMKINKLLIRASNE